MAKTKADLLKAAQPEGLVATDATEDDFTGEQLVALLTPDRPAWEGSASAKEPIVAADGHVVLSQEDIDSRG